MRIETRWRKGGGIYTEVTRQTATAAASAAAAPFKAGAQGKAG